MSTSDAIKSMTKIYATLLEMPHRGNFRAESTIMHGSEVHQYQIDIDRRSGRWSTENGRSGSRSWFDRSTRTGQVDGADITGGSFFEDWPCHDSVRLAMPEKLLIWGRRNDSFQPLSSTQIDEDNVVMSLIHIEDPAILGTVTVDVTRRLFTRLVTPYEVYQLDKVSPY